MVYGSQRFNASFTKGSPIIPILNRINQIPRIDTYLFNINSSIVLQLSLVLPKGIFLEGLFVKILKVLIPYFNLTRCPTHLNVLYLTILSKLGVRYTR